MQLFRRFCIMLKRPFKQPVFLMMLFFLLFMTYLASRVPDDRRSTNIPVAILNYDTSPEGIRLTELLLQEQSLFRFYVVDDEDTMYRDLTSGEANTGYIIPEGFMKDAAMFKPDVQIDQILTEGSLLPTISMDVLFSVTFRIEAYAILESELDKAGILGSAAPDPSALLEKTHELYSYYMGSGEIFRVSDLSGTVYSGEISHSRIDIPVRKLSAFFLLAAGLLGLISYLNDRERQLYLRFTSREHAAMKLMHIESSLLLPAAISYPAILLTERTGALMLLLRLFVYLLAVTVFVWILSILFKRSRSLMRVLPLYLLLTLLLGGIFYDLGSYNPVLKAISSLFLPYYF